ncbi:hypothetical protein TYRP_004013 [Tyrophagus putrescentiae]|nr:hypothetical protein TYRP_004013 [Tyrophagus putrescentiae]
MSSRYLRKVLQSSKLPSRHIQPEVLEAYKGEVGQATELKFLWQYKKDAMQKRFAKFGKNSGLKPGVCYPTNEELEYLTQYEATFEKSVARMRDDLRRRQTEAAEARTRRTREVEKNLAKMPTLKKDFWAKYHQLYEDIEREKEKKEKVIQEVREYLGYDIQPNDPRFEEALLKKDEEEKAAMRAARKLEKARQGMEMLQEMVAAALEKEKKSSSSRREEQQ